MVDSTDLRCYIMYFIVQCCYNYLVFHECKHLSLFNYITIISTSDQGNTKYFCENFNEVETANVQPSKSFHVYSIAFSKIAVCQQQLTSNSVISVLLLVYQCFQNFPPTALFFACLISPLPHSISCSIYYPQIIGIWLTTKYVFINSNDALCNVSFVYRQKGMQQYSYRLNSCFCMAQWEHI